MQSRKSSPFHRCKKLAKNWSTAGIPSYKIKNKQLHHKSMIHMYKVSYNFRKTNIKHIKHAIMYIDHQITVFTNLSKCYSQSKGRQQSRISSCFEKWQHSPLGIFLIFLVTRYVVVLENWGQGFSFGFRFSEKI